MDAFGCLLAWYLGSQMRFGGLQILGILGQKRLLGGVSDAIQRNCRMPFGRHKIVMDVIFPGWCEVNTKIFEWFCGGIANAMFLSSVSQKNKKKYFWKKK